MPFKSFFMALLLLCTAWLAQAQSCLSADASAGWSYQAIAASGGRFTVQLDATPATTGSNAVVGLSQGHQVRNDMHAALVRFGADGSVQAQDGTTFTASRSYTYKAGVSYRLRFDIDLATHRYSVWVQSLGGRASRRVSVQIGKDLAFPAALAGLAQLDTIGLQTVAASRGDAGSLQICKVVLEQITPPLPPNPNCTLIVPDAPLTAQGLATPYQLVATDPAQGACHQTNPDQAAFVEAAVLDPATGKISIYAPLVIDKDTQPAVAPVLPTLPANAVVGLWFGYNGDTLTLDGSRRTLSGNGCVNGVSGSPFGQFAYCNAPAFFSAAHRAISRGQLVVPPLGTGLDGQTCPSTRDYAVIDQDPSDNVPSEYLIVNGRLAQRTSANMARFPNAIRLANPSDERIVSVLFDPALGCAVYTADNLADPGQQAPSLALNELQAAVHQKDPVALIPVQDPMVLVDGQRNLAKLNAYRAGIDQSAARNVSDASARDTCSNLRSIAPARLTLDQPYLQVRPSPFPDIASNLYTFLANRYVSSYAILDCPALLGRKVNMKLTTNAAGVVVDAVQTR